MFFEDDKNLVRIAKRTSCVVFVVSSDTKINIKPTLTLEPSLEKSTELISADSLRDFLSYTDKKLTKDEYFIIKKAHTMSEHVQNIFLKTLEEPRDFCHFVLLTENPSSLLPTILSRVQIFYPKVTDRLNQPPQCDAKYLTLAKKLISATATDLPKLATEIASKKNQPRQVALDTTAIAIELLYKSYFKTKNRQFIAKIPKFITLYDNLKQNGHIKLHIVADLC